MGLRAAHGAKCLRGPLCYEERGKYARELAAFTRDLSEAADYRRKPFNPYNGGVGGRNLALMAWRATIADAGERDKVVPR